MTDYLLTEVDVSSGKGFQDDEILEPITQADLNFINDDDSLLVYKNTYPISWLSSLQ